MSAFIIKLEDSNYSTDPRQTADELHDILIGEGLEVISVEPWASHGDSAMKDLASTLLSDPKFQQQQSPPLS